MFTKSMQHNPENSVILRAGPSEMLRVAEDGFYVRGVPVPADEKEALEVYNCFKEWLAWAALNK